VDFGTSQSSVDDRPGKHDGKVISPYSAYNSNADYQNIRKVSVPVILIAGDDDCVSDPVVCASRIHALIKSSDLCVIKNAGHFAWIEQPDAFWKGIKDFFERNQVRSHSDK
jgi:pimeloyl-ACP methyl ester carboxylesterase